MQSVTEFGNSLPNQAGTEQGKGNKPSNLQVLPEDNLEQIRESAQKQEKEQVQNIFKIFHKSKAGSGHKSKRSGAAGKSSETRASSRERMGLQKEDSLPVPAAPKKEE